MTAEEKRRTVHGVPVEKAKERLAAMVTEYGDPEASIDWGFIEGRSLALARLTLDDTQDPLPDEWQDYAEAEDVRDVIQGEYDDE